MRKKKILVVNEYSELNSGFATYMHYLLPLLHATGKYEIAELGVYVNEMHPKFGNVPWKSYANEPHPGNPHEKNVYHSDPVNQFGKFRFHQVLLDFKPDVVINIADPWMQSYINQSPHRRHFKYIHMPTVDGYPQKQEWLEDYALVDILLTYSEFGKNVLESQSGGKIKVFGVASPGVDIDTFKPIDKTYIRNKFGLTHDAIIIQSVMRNQPRKLYPEIMNAFNILLKNPEIDTSKVFLHFHTSNPDMGWDLPAEIVKRNLSNKILFTYMCDRCNHVGLSFYHKNVQHCPRCKNDSFRLPDSSIGVSRQQLAEIMNLADIYVQYSICEGWGIPSNDAKSCGIPSILVDYSAMSEQAYSPGGIPIKVQTFVQERVNETGQSRAMPDNNHLAHELAILISNPEHRKNIGQEGRNFVVQQYNWQKIAKVWEKAIDSTPFSSSWNSPPIQLQLPSQIPNIPNDLDFVNWCFANILKKPEMVNSRIATVLANYLSEGHTQAVSSTGNVFKMKADRKEILQKMANAAQEINQAEKQRTQVDTPGQLEIVTL